MFDKLKRVFTGFGPGPNSKVIDDRIKPIQIQIEEEKEVARQLTEEGKAQEAAVQWDIVEELSAEAADQSWYQKWCDENPGDANCKMYD